MPLNFDHNPHSVDFMYRILNFTSKSLNQRTLYENSVMNDTSTTRFFLVSIIFFYLFQFLAAIVLDTVEIKWGEKVGNRWRNNKEDNVKKV